MHLLVRETRSLDEEAPAADLEQAPAPLVVMSFSDADLGAVAAAWTAGGPGLRLASLGTLRHPLSVDLYLEKTLGHARCVVIRLLGGVEYWRYGVEEVVALCGQRGIALALLPGDGQDDRRLRALSTVSEEAWSALDGCFRAGGCGNMVRVLGWAAHLAGLGGAPAGEAVALPQHGVLGLDLVPGALAAVVFYRSHLLSDDIAPILALAEALRGRGLRVGLIYVGSLKSGESGAWVARTLRAWRPAVVVNATGFSARGDRGSPLDAADVPVLQVVLSGSRVEAWRESGRGLSPADLAMHVVLPELDGRLLTTAISFKAESGWDEALQYRRTIHAPYQAGIELAAGRAAGWSRLAGTARRERRVAVVLSDYPGIGGQEGHAVGLDTFASLSAILGLLVGAGYDAREMAAGELTAALCGGGDDADSVFGGVLGAGWDAAGGVWEGVRERWGEPEGDFWLRVVWIGSVVVALQPDRGGRTDRRSGYHDPDEPPCHGYLAFYLWLRCRVDVHAVVHLGRMGVWSGCLGRRRRFLRRAGRRRWLGGAGCLSLYRQ